MTQIKGDDEVSMQELDSLDSVDFLRSRHSRVAIISIFLVMGALAAFDVLNDLSEGTSVAHLAIEGVTVLLCLAIVAYMTIVFLRDAFAHRRDNERLKTNLAQSQQKAAEWRAAADSLLIGLGRSINRQFEVWNLSPGEKEIALFLLKGLSHKEIAHLRNVGDATVRQQSRSIYKKAEVVGRHGLAAFFLEDLALPAEDRDSDVD